jgi:hypothetical protein
MAFAKAHEAGLVDELSRQSPADVYRDPAEPVGVCPYPATGLNRPGAAQLMLELCQSLYLG